MGLWWRGRKVLPRGFVISPLLANLFLHYVFDKWMERNYPQTPFCRYADDGVAHGRTEAEALSLKGAVEASFRECNLELHPEKTRVVYGKDEDRRGDYPNTSFDFLGFTFRPRRSKNRWGKYFVNFSPAVSNKAGKAMRQKARRWHLHPKVTRHSLTLLFTSGSMRGPWSDPAPTLPKAAH